MLHCVRDMYFGEFLWLAKEPKQSLDVEYRHVYFYKTASEMNIISKECRRDREKERQQKKLNKTNMNVINDVD